MILRKPYALLIKYFKLIHIIMTALLFYLVYKSSMILNFLNSYLSSNQNVIGAEMTDSLFNTLMFIVPFLIIIVSIVIIALMYQKKKPILFYVGNIIGAIAVIAFYAYANNVIGTMEVQLVDIRIVRAVRDIATGIYASQLLSSIITFVRATGFDVKKFNFSKDLEELKIKEEDREEFEVNLEVDTHKTRRNVRRFIRYSRYIYLENKYLINTIVVVLIVSFSFWLFMDRTVYNKTYSSNALFSTVDFNMTITDSYITSEDNKGNIITPENYSLVVIKTKIKTKGKLDKKLNTSKTAIKVDGRLYFPVLTYRSKTLDLGNTYEEQMITSEYSYYTLTYQVPTLKLDKGIEFNYIENITFTKGKINPNTIHIKTSPKKLDGKETVKEFELDKSIDLKGSILKDSNIIVKTNDINNTFTHKYNFCLNTKDCYESVEYIKPSIINTKNKIVLKLTGEFKIDDKTGVSTVNSLYKFFQMFGSIEYEKDGIKNIQKDGFKEVVPEHGKDNNTAYIEILEEIKDASKITLIFTVRNNVYRYILR